MVREGKHVVMSDGRRILAIRRHNPVNAFTMGARGTQASPSNSFANCFEVDGGYDEANSFLERVSAVGTQGSSSKQPWIH
jgi:hypothetical protein